MTTTINKEVAARMKEVARLLDEQGANQFRVRAYRRGVVLYYDGEEGEKQCTVVTAKKGPLAGSRVVRGRETESAAFYNSQRGGG